MKSNLPKYLAIGIIVLVVVLIGAKWIYNKQMNKIAWEEGDRDIMISTCIEDLSGYAVRFPSQSTDYCSCTADTLMKHYTKTEYLIMEAKENAEKEKEMLPIILECYNAYQEAIFKASSID
jgi:hypothetical protein